MIEGNAECLISCNTAQLLGVIIVDVNRINSPNIQRLNESNTSGNESQNFQCSLENVYKRFPKLFTGELGCMKDIEVKLDIDPSVRPTTSKADSVPSEGRSRKGAFKADRPRHSRKSRCKKWTNSMGRKSSNSSPRTSSSQFKISIRDVVA